MQCRIGHFQLGRNAGDPGDSTAGSLASAVLEEGGLADSRLPAHDQYRALTLVDAVQQLVEHAAFACPSPECRRPSCDHPNNMPSSRACLNHRPTPLQRGPVATTGPSRVVTSE